MILFYILGSQVRLCTVVRRFMCQFKLFIRCINFINITSCLYICSMALLCYSVLLTFIAINNYPQTSCSCAQKNRFLNCNLNKNFRCFIEFLMRGPRKGCARELDIPDAHDSLLCVAASLSTIGNKA